MTRSAKSLEHYDVRARDGEVGRVKDVYFDDAQWRVRYFIVDTGTWLTGRTVLVTPGAVEEADWAQRSLRVALTRDQVRNSPDIETQRPVSRQQEIALHDYYAWPYYWTTPVLDMGYGSPIVPGAVPAAAALRAGREAQREELVQRGGAAAEARQAAETEGDPHLRSAHAVRGYSIDALDGSIGHVEDLLLEDTSWAVSAIVIDTRNWWPGKKVPIAPAQVRAIDWSTSTMKVGLTREAIKSGPTLDSDEPVRAVRLLATPFGRRSGPSHPQGRRPRRAGQSPRLVTDSAAASLRRARVRSSCRCP